MTGRWAMSIRRCRSCTRSGAMSGSSSLSGPECTPGTKNPVGLKNARAPSPTSVTSRIAGTLPSASNGASSLHRLPGHRAAAHDHRRARWNELLEFATERRERLPAARKGKADDVVAFLMLREPTLDRGVINRLGHAGGNSKIAPAVPCHS